MKIIVMFKMSQLKVALFAIKGNAEDMDQLSPVPLLRSTALHITWTVGSLRDLC
jgi:hypothetical protein